MFRSFNDMINKKNLLDEQFLTRIKFLEENIKNLLRAYRVSIGLSDDKTWKDKDNFERSYVLPMDLVNDEYVLKGTNAIKSNPCKYFIGTVLGFKQSKPEVAGCWVILKTDVNAKSLFVTVGSHPTLKEFEVEGGDFSNVCLEIQKITFQDIDRFKKN
ncbi:hypothetical protein [Raoultella scottii]|uniref:hypothetical protein n=1 Tax=Raoultella scottii TaxID=3040937 RepID=UPI002F9C595A